MEENIDSTGSAANLPDKEWTIMVYMAGDNNLSEDMITALNELNAGHASASKPAGGNPPTASKINFFIEFDPSHPTAETERFFIGEKAMSNGTVSRSDIFTPLSDPIKSFDKIEDSIKNFVIDGIAAYPAKRYALIISGHSDAFQGRTLLLDENPAGTATLKTLNIKIREALDAALPSGELLDILGFDSCVMNTLEVTYEFRDVTKYWVGSQGSIPNYTWDYRGIGSELAKITAFDPTDIIRIIIEQTRDFNHRYSINGRSIDISGFKVSDLFEPQFVDDIKELIDALNAYLLIPFLILLLDQYQKQPSFDEKLDFTRFSLLRMLVLVHWKCQNNMHNQSVDFLDFCECLEDACRQLITETKENADSEASLTESAQFLIAASDNILTKCSIAIAKIKNAYTKGACIGADQRFSNGFSMFLPWSFMAYGMSKKNYEELDFIKNTDVGKSWKNFVIFLTVLTQRPRPYLRLDLIDPQIFKILEDSPLEKIHKESFLISIFNLLIGNLFESGGGVKDDPKRTRGLDDDYSFYFRRMKNIRSNPEDLKFKHDFGKP